MADTKQEQVRGLVERAVEPYGFRLVDVRSSQNKLNVYLDGAESDITLEECRTASRAIERLVDPSGLFPEKYVLEVSSPGNRRPLAGPGDFKRVAGRTLAVTTAGADGGTATFIGVLADADADGISLAGKKGATHRIGYDDIVKAKIKYVI